MILADILQGEAGTKLAESGLTSGWLVETLLKCNAEFKKALGGGKVAELDTKDISDGEGYASRVYKVTLKLTKANRGEYAVIMKVPTKAKLDKLQEDMSEQMKDGAMDSAKEVWDKIDVSDIHNAECAFYEAVRDVEDFPLPTVWYTRKNSQTETGVILMEDMSDLGCKTGFVHALTAQQLRNVTRHFAALHAFHLCAGRDQLNKIDDIPSNTSYLINEQMADSIVACVQQLQDEALMDLLKKLKPAGTSKFVTYAMFERPKELGIPPLLCQGDSGGHNMFFKKAEDGTVSNDVYAFLDWQLTLKGNPFFDISKLVVAFSDADVRREVESSLVEEYYGHLKNGVEKAGGKKLDFGLEQIQAALISVGFLFFMQTLVKDKVSPGVFEALREKSLLRTKFALVDAVESLKKYAPQFLAD